jgi:2-polyprenyl-6-methoxyphenol hydroxylase-like FAD-dependent oxidoreductase
MKAITIIGGGLSGLCLGIGLRRRGVPVRIFEAGDYPRHKVCGEFLSGRGRDVLAAMEMESRLPDARIARDVIFSLGADSTAPRALPAPALCISRWRMDAAFADYFSELGGELTTSHRAPLDPGEGIVRATGRRPQAEEGGWRLFGLKAHAHGVNLRAGLEMHFTSRGYVGLCAVEDGRVNVCGLFRSRGPVPELARDWRLWLRGDPGSLLHERLAQAEWDDSSFSSVAALSLAARTAAISGEMSVGDAVTMIPPVTGNGMSMACESAAAAIEPLAGWADGALSWGEAEQKVSLRLNAVFARRLRVAALLQRAVVVPAARRVLFWSVRLVPWLQSLLFKLTR